MENTTRSDGVGDYDARSPCYFLREAVNAVLKCLGFDSSKPYVDDDINNPSSCSKEKNQDDQYATSNPPSTTMDPADDPTMEDLARRGRTPPRPRISTGRDPQTNSTPS